jgi:hypothetical protein
MQTVRPPPCEFVDQQEAPMADCCNGQHIEKWLKMFGQPWKPRPKSAAVNVALHEALCNPQLLCAGRGANLSS